MRQLTSKEIESLQASGCSADDWKNISVADGFNPDSVSKKQRPSPIITQR